MRISRCFAWLLWYGFQDMRGYERTRVCFAEALRTRNHVLDSEPSPGFVLVFFAPCQVLRILEQAFPLYRPEKPRLAVRACLSEMPRAGRERGSRSRPLLQSAKNVFRDD